MKQTPVLKGLKKRRQHLEGLNIINKVFKKHLIQTFLIQRNYTPSTIAGSIFNFWLIALA